MCGSFLHWSPYERALMNFKTLLSCFPCISFISLFLQQDKDNRVRRKEFRKILDTFPFRITDGQFKLLMYRIDPEGKGYVSYHDFLENFESREGKVCF